jgi:hypothetical protein
MTGVMGLRKQVEIRTESYIRVGGEPVRFCDLPDDLKRQAATRIKTDYLNALYRGIAVFAPVERRTENENT